MVSGGLSDLSTVKMHENGYFCSANNSSRARGRGRGLWRAAANQNGLNSVGRGIWIKEDCSSHLTRGTISHVPKEQLQKNSATHKQRGHLQVHHQPVASRPLMGNSLRPSVVLQSENSTTYPPSNQQLVSHTSYDPPLPFAASSSSQSSIPSNVIPKPLLSTANSPRQILLLQHRIRPESNNTNKSNIPPLFSPLELKKNFYHNLQAELGNNKREVVKSAVSSFNPDFQRNRPSSISESNRSFDVGNADLGPNKRSNKRPVNSPTNGNKTSPNQRDARLSGPNNKKKNKKRKKDGEVDNKDDKNKSLVNEELFKLKVDENKSFAEQTDELISQLEQDDIGKKMRLQVLEDVLEIFSPHLPGVEPQIYGSTLTNIAFKCSDLDIFLYCPNGQPEYNFVLEKGRLMYRSHKFTSVVRVPRARVPVIKATHIDANIDVDISTMSGQAVYNSLLIKHLLSADDRLRPLAMLISLWSKLNAVTGHSRFTSYSIVLLFIYYLQQITPPILPPLKDILYSKKINEWPNFFFDKPLMNENTTEVSELFKGFFQFYVNFKFEKVVLSPYLGKEVPVSHFIHFNELTDDFITYKNKLNEKIPPFMITNFIHIQDPLEHNVNTTKGVFPRLLKLFRRSCERIVVCCQAQTPQNLWLSAMLKRAPLKITNEKQFEFKINYPVNGEDWFENCKKHCRETLDILLIRVTEDQRKTDTVSDDGLKKDTFFAEANYNVFNKKFRSSLRLYLQDTINLTELQKQFKLVINRINSLPVLFKATFSLKQQKEKPGTVKVTIIDKNTTGMNSFISLAESLKRHYNKFLNDVASDKKTSIEDHVVNIKETVVMDCDGDNKELMNLPESSNQNYDLKVNPVVKIDIENGEIEKCNAKSN